MWITFVIVASFVVAMVAMAYFGIQSQEDAVQREAAEHRAHESTDSAHCGLCKAPLRRSATTDEVVFELEHRIDAERGEIARAWHTAAEVLGRTFPA
jgi:hypothetical protein